MLRNKSQAVLDGPGWMQRQLREAGLVAAVSLALFLIIALLSHHPDDPGWSSSGAGGNVHNLIGSIGAWTADVLLSLFGYVAFLLPALVALVGWFVYRGKGLDETRHIAPVWRSGALLLCALSLCALTALHIGGSATVTPQGSGGILGLVMGNSLVAVLNSFGATLLLLTVLVAALPVALVFSWLQLLDRVGGGLQSLTRHLAQRAKPATVSAPGVIRNAPAVGAVTPVAPQAPLKDKKKRKMPFVGDNQMSLPIGSGEKGADVPKFAGDPLPPLSILDPPRPPVKGYTAEDLERISRERRESTCWHFGVEAKVVAAQPGPVITRFELQLAPGVKGAQISNLAQRSGAIAVGVTGARDRGDRGQVRTSDWRLPNQKRDIVMLSEILRSDGLRATRIRR